MKVKKGASGNKNSQNESKAADSLEVEKQKLKKEILELQTLISQVEKQNTDITKFSDVTNVEELVTTSKENPVSTKVPDLDVIFRVEMYNYVGFRCIKVTKTEYVFNFACTGKKEETFSVQIWNKDGKGSLGNWVMPMSVDIKKILDKAPVNNLAMVIPFLKSCKQEVDCYGERKNQFHELKAHVSDTSNCEIDANLGFTLITLRLLGVYNKPNDSYVDLTITLIYKSNETRPCAIGVDWSLRKDPSLLQENEMKSYAKFLKNQRLLEGFKHMTESTHPVFVWTTEEYVNSPLELNNSSDSDEESIVITAKRKRKKITTRRQKDRELKERWRKRQKRTSLVARSQDGNSTDEENEDPLSESRPSARTRSSTQSLENSRSPKKSKEPLQSSKLAAEKNTKSKNTFRKLRQTTISFSGNKTNTKDQNSANIPAQKILEIVAAKNSKGENARAKKSEIGREKNVADETEDESETIEPKSVTSKIKKSAIPKAIKSAIGSKKNVADKTEKKSESVEPKSVTSKVKKSAIPKTKKSAIGSKKNVADKTEKKSESVEPKSVISEGKKSAIPKAKPRPIGIMSAKKTGVKKINYAATSTPLHKKVQSKVKFAAMNDMAISPIASADENE